MRCYPIAAVCCLLALTAQQASAQGTAAAPSTAHVIDSTNTVWIGGPNDPINGPAPQPIDLDVDGLPWRKGISTGDGPNDVFGGGTLRLIESITNSGDEPWTDWHEIDAGIGSHGTVWGSVLDVQVNGSSIGYSSTITPTTIDLYDFSQPVLPGDELRIEKTLIALTDNLAGPGTLVASILQYPTTNVPEPSTVMLATAVGLIGRRRRR